jgi:hypothetical protein
MHLYHLWELVVYLWYHFDVHGAEHFTDGDAPD